MHTNKTESINSKNNKFNIIHTADWHLGQKFYDYERNNEHEKFLEWLISNIKEKKTDLLVISGDIFDTSSPSSSAQEMFYTFLFNLTKIQHKVNVVIIAGNHDGASRLEAPAALMKILNISIIGSIKKKEGNIDIEKNILNIKDDCGKIRCFIVAIPFLRQGDYPVIKDAENPYSAGVSELYKTAYARIKSQDVDYDVPIIALGHLHSGSASLSDSERGIRGGMEIIDHNLFDIGYDYIGLGHIHKSQKIGGRDNIRYSGSPIPMSFSEVNYIHKVIEIRFDGKETMINELIIPRFTDILRIGTPEKPISKEEAMIRLHELMDAEIEEESRDEYPFLEVNIILETPDILLAKQITDIADKKRVRLVSSRVYYKKEDSESLKYVSESIEDFKELSPIEMLERVYKKRFGFGVPDNILSLYTEVIDDLDKRLK